MADNYIEKRMEELKSGTGSASHAPFNFDSVALRSSEPVHTDPSYVIHPLQQNAVRIAVQRAGIPGVEIELPEGGLVAFKGGDLLNVGRAVQTAILKAASMGLAAIIVTPCEPPFSACLKLGRPLK